MKSQKPSITVIRADHIPQAALQDLWLGLARFDMWSRFAFHEIRQRFRRSILGPFWLTASMGVFVAALGLISSTLFHQDITQTLPFIATGIIFWGLITNCIIEGSTLFFSREGYIRNVPMPLSVHLYQMIARNLIIWLFNMVIYIAILIYLQFNPGWNILLFLICGPLLVINVTWMALFAGVLSARFRDIPQVITSLVQVIFFVTPVFWSVKTLPSRPAFVTYNPMYHLLETIREPFLGQTPTALNWAVSIGLAVIGCTATAILYRRAQPRIAYWV